MEWVNQILQEKESFNLKPFKEQSSGRLEGYEQIEFNLSNTHQLQLVSLKNGKTRIKFLIPEKDIDEQFTKGFGPGGQKTNKSNNCVVLTHKPTGLQSRSHDNRLQQINRKIARKNLIDMLDVYLNGENSKQQLRIERTQKSKERRERRREQNLINKQNAQNQPEEQSVNIEEVKNEIIEGVLNEQLQMKEEINQTAEKVKKRKKEIQISDSQEEIVVSDTDFEQYDMTKIGSGRLSPKIDLKTGKKKKR